MLFLVGTRDFNVKNGVISNEKCPKCDTENSLHFSIFRKYAHLTFIPLFPVGKILVVKCNNCKITFDYEDLSENGQLKMRSEKLDATLWTYSGSIIIFIVSVFFLNNYFSAKDETAILIKNPTEGDVYNLKFPNGYYSNMRIDKVTSDSIYTTHNDFDAYMPYEVDDLNKPENYSDKKFSYSRQELLKLYKEDEIIKISRKKLD